MTLKEKILLEIEAMGYKSVRDFAVKNDIPVTTIRAIFSGVTPNLKTLYLISESLNLCVCDFLKDVDLDKMFKGEVKHGY